MPGRPWRLLGIALLWLLLANVGGLGGWLGACLAYSLLQGWTPMQGLSALQDPGFVPVVLSVAFAGQTIMLLAARWQGRRLGGNVSIGLGDVPVRRWRLVAALLVVQLAACLGTLVLIRHVPVIRHAAQNLLPLIGDALAAGFVPASAAAILALLLAPLAEEWFFRGWLWTGLRQSWGPVGTGLLTGGSWLLLHVDSGLWKPLFILPQAILFSLARHYGGSMRASLWLHVTNNAVSLMLQAARL